MNILRAIKFLKKGKTIFTPDSQKALRLMSHESVDPYGNPVIEKLVTQTIFSQKLPYVFTEEDLTREDWMIGA